MKPKEPINTKGPILPSPGFSAWKAALIIIPVALIGIYVIFRSFASAPPSDSEAVQASMSDVLAKRYTIQLVGQARKLS